MSGDACPHCGGNTADDAAITRGRWWLHPAAAVFDGIQARLTRTQSRILYTIARANGEAVSHRDLWGSMTPHTLTAHVSDIRKALGDNFPVRTVTGRGFAWDARP